MKKKSLVRWIIKDWAGNICFNGQEFDTFEDCWAFIRERFPDDEEEWGEYFPEALPIEMFCWSCGENKTFTVEDEEDGPVCECGHWQDSEEQGAHEICLAATWHDLDEYKRVAEIARSGGYEVPETPNNYRS